MHCALALGALPALAGGVRAQAVQDCPCGEDAAAIYNAALEKRLDEAEEVRRRSNLPDARPDPGGVAPVISAAEEARAREQAAFLTQLRNQPLQDSRGTEVARTTVLGLILIRDMYIAQAFWMAGFFDSIREGGAEDKRLRAREIFETSVELARLHARAEAAEAARMSAPYSSIAVQTEAHKQAAAEAKRAFESALEAAQRQFPEINVPVDGVPLWQAFAGQGGKDMLGNPVIRRDRQSEQERIEIYNRHLTQGAADLRGRARAAQDHDTTKDLWQYGRPEFKGIRDAVRMEGKSVGSDLPSQFMDQVEGVRIAYDIHAMVDTGWTKVILAGVGLIFLPITPLVCLGVGVIDVTMEGTELVIQLGDASDAQKAEPILGRRHVITAEERAKAQAGQFVVAVIGLGVDVAAVRSMRVVGKTPPECPKEVPRVAAVDDAAGGARAGEASPAGGRVEAPRTIDPCPVPAGPLDEVIGANRLTAEEAAALQQIADKYNTPIYVYGSRARDEGRRVGEANVPVGKGAERRSDIDVVFDYDVNRAHGGAVIEDLKKVGNRAVGPHPENDALLVKPDPPYIVFRPGECAKWERIPGTPAPPTPVTRTEGAGRAADAAPPAGRIDAPSAARPDAPPADRMPTPPPPAEARLGVPDEAARDWLDWGDRLAPRDKRRFSELMEKSAREGLTADEAEWLTRTGREARRWGLTEMEARRKGLLDERLKMPEDAAMDWLDWGDRLAPRDKRRFMELMEKSAREGLTAAEVEWLRRTAGEAKRWGLAEMEGRRRGLLADGVPAERLTDFNDLPARLKTDVIDVQHALSRADKARLDELLAKGRLTDEEIEWLVKTLGEAHERVYKEPPPYGLRPRTGVEPAVARPDDAPVGPLADDAGRAEEIAGEVKPVERAEDRVVRPVGPVPKEGAPPATAPAASQALFVPGQGTTVIPPIVFTFRGGLAINQTANLLATTTMGRDATVQIVILSGPEWSGEPDGTRTRTRTGFIGSEDLVPGGGIVFYDPDLKVFLQGLGTLGNDAIEMKIFGTDPGSPVQITAEGLVVEPVDLKEEAKKRLEEELHKLAARNPITAKIDAYCLDFLRQPPDLGTVFRIADQEIQQRFASAGKVLSAGRRLHEMGLLNPDSDPEEYFHSIRQWALWSVQENLDLGTFGSAFVEHTRKNLEAAGEPWTGEIEALVREIIPNRWNDISRILGEARASSNAGSDSDEGAAP